jgi:crotonobetainyl-CoA:carnitine CoA-transferase CaiB-like acyl-CoA transferase
MKDAGSDGPDIASMRKRDSSGEAHSGVGGARGALSHLRVLDLSRVLAGPWATQLLGDLGAEVIKVERPGTGDDTRSWGPPYLRGPDGRDTSESAYYLCANRNKKSVTIDWMHPRGQQLVRALALQSDVLVENFKVGSLARHGLDHATLAKANPRLIYCSITGFGQTGPYAARPGYDFLVQGMGGLMSLGGRPEGEPGAGPMKAGVAIVDILTGLYASNAILAALAWRERSGAGQHIDLALLDVQVACLANQALNYLTTGRPPERLGNAHPSIVPYQDFRTADGYILIAVGNDRQFARLCEVLDRAALASDPRFATNVQRVAHRDVLVPLLGEVMRTRASAAWLRLLEAAGVPSGPINDLAQVFADPQVRARGMQLELPHASAGRVPQVATPARLSATPPEYRAPPPALGEHTDEVLRDVLDLDDAEITALRSTRVI